MRPLVWSCGAAAAGLTCVAAGAQTPAPATTQWHLEWKNPYCAVSTGDPTELGVSVWHVPGSDFVELYMMAPKGRLPKIPHWTPVTIETSTGEKIPTTASLPAGEWRGVLKFGFNLADFERLKGTTSLAVVAPKARFETPVRGIVTAAKAAFDCADAKLPDWGVDPAALKALKRRPAAVPRGKKQGNRSLAVRNFAVNTAVAILRVRIDTAGKVTSCDIVESTANRDRWPCKIVKDVRYTPAVGANGQAIATTIIIPMAIEMTTSVTVG